MLLLYDHSAQQLKLHVNGNLVASGYGNLSYGYRVALGALPIGTGFFGGRMDEVRFWNYARTQSEIQSTMNAFLTGNESGLMRYYIFEDSGIVPGGNNTAYSSTADVTNSYDGSLSNFARTGCTDPAACNYYEFATCNEGCFYEALWYFDHDADGYGNDNVTFFGCYAPPGYILAGGDCEDLNPNVNPGELEIACNGVDENCNGLVDENGWMGCTDADALDYNANASCDDGTCLVAGCMYPLALNYDPTANVDDGSCIFEGCTDPSAINYDPMATVDDGSCIESGIPGCTYPTAANYNPAATVEDSSCQFLDNCPADLDNNGVINVNDLLAFMGYFGSLCP